MERDIPPLKFSDIAGLSEVPPGLIPGTQEHELLVSEYRPWRKVRPIARDLGIPPEVAWARVKHARLFGWREIELKQPLGSAFGICICPQILRSLHTIDRATGGGGAAVFDPYRGELGDETVRDKLRIRTLMDEAAESSLIEGAATTRKEAVELLRSGRSPTTHAERMVVNNYVALQHVKQSLTKPLSIELLLELQTILTRDTLDHPDEAGRFRRADETIRVVDERTGDAIFTPPSASSIRERLSRLCAFANSPHADAAAFLHPIIKACILHFMVGYEHPFCDGNGRTARAVFYWFALKNGYSIFEFAAISELIRKGFARYPQAYLDTELDEGDLTYFVLFHLDIIEQALARLAEHIRHEQEKVRRSESLLRVAKDLNIRQRLILEHALRHPTTRYTVKSHMNSNGIVAATARSDLDGLVKHRLMLVSKLGRETQYTISPTFEARLHKRLNKA